MVLNDSKIRKCFHTNILNKSHLDNNTFVIDELGLQFGNYRADIAVLNNSFSGYEIKGEKDSLNRLERQITAYNSVFDYSTVIISSSHLRKIKNYIPRWWGVIICEAHNMDEINFYDFKRPDRNPGIDLFSITQLLWKNEVIEILTELNIDKSYFRKPRELLYRLLLDIYSEYELKQIILGYFKSRKDWRCPQLLFQYGDLSQQISK